MSLKSQLLLSAFNAFGKKTGRKFLVLESDDWGAVRMPSRLVYEKLLAKKIIDPSDMFARFDGLASENDFSHLFEALSSFKDLNGRPPVMTANCVVANPDFDKIKANHFTTYICESIEETYQRYPQHANSFGLWKEGVKKGLFYPQYHSREHVNVPAWMRLLKQRHPHFLEAFDYGTYAVNASIVASLKVHTPEDQLTIKTILQDGYNRFEKLFGFKSESFIAPNYTWNDGVETVLNDLNVKILQGSKKQNVPLEGEGRMRSRYHFTGQSNKNGQLYLVRNCLFEPSVSPSIDYTALCLRQIRNAFAWNTPAIVGTHRLNYVGFLDERNRNNNIKNFKRLIRNVLKEFPDVEFVTTAALGKILIQKN